MDCAKRKCVFKHVQNAQIQSHPTHVQSLICSLLKQAIVPNDSVYGQ